MRLKYLAQSRLGWREPPVPAPPPPRPGCYTNLPLLSHLIPVQLPVPDDDKIGSRIYFSKEVSQLQKRPHFVTRAQNLNLKTIHCIQLL